MQRICISLAGLAILSACADKEPVSNEDLPPLPSFALFDGSNFTQGYTGDNPSAQFEVRFKYPGSDEVVRRDISATFPTYWEHPWSLGIGKREGFDPAKGLYNDNRVFPEYTKANWQFRAAVEDGQGPPLSENPEFVRFPTEEAQMAMLPRLDYYVPPKYLDRARQIAEHGEPWFTPMFRTTQSGKAEFDCETDLRTLAFQSPYEVIDYEGLRWERAKDTWGGTAAYRVFVNYDNRTWSISRQGSEGRFPSDHDSDGSVWDPIEAGSDNYLCFRELVFPNGFGEKVDCSFGLNLTTGELKRMDVPTHFSFFAMSNGQRYKYSRPVGYYEMTADWEPGSINTEIGSCRPVED